MTEGNRVFRIGLMIAIVAFGAVMMAKGSRVWEILGAAQIIGGAALAALHIRDLIRTSR